MCFAFSLQLSNLVGSPTSFLYCFHRPSSDRRIPLSSWRDIFSAMETYLWLLNATCNSSGAAMRQHDSAWRLD